MMEIKPFNISKRAVVTAYEKVKANKEHIELMDSQLKILKRI